MKPEHLSDALNLLPDDLLEETDKLRGHTGSSADMRRPKRLPAVRAAALLLCAIAVCWAGLRLVPADSKPLTDSKPPAGSEDSASATSADTEASPSELPLLTITELRSDGMGFEGLMAYDISELTNGNPWKESECPAVLPVYKNSVSYSDGWQVLSPDWEAMETLLQDLSARLLPDSAELELKKEEDPYAPYLTASADGVSLRISHSLTADVKFEQGRSPSDESPSGGSSSGGSSSAESSFSYNADYDGMVSAAEYFKNTSADLLNMKNPQADIDGGYYDIYGQQHYQLSFFDTGDTVTETLLNYNFYRTNLYPAEEGTLSLIRVFRPDLSEKLGDYPLITSDRAKEFLLRGQYLTSVPYVPDSEESVKKVELIYRTGAYETLYLPYYRFYVELPEEKQKNGLNTYGIYYVPAVEERYLLWDGADANVFQ